MDTTSSNFRLKDYSPCIGAGIDSIEIAGVWYYVPPFCIEGNPRPNPTGSMPDLGACESPLADPISAVEDLSEIPKKYSLNQNYPNPFNPSTVIGFQLPISSDVTLTVYDLLGREITTLVDEYKPAGQFKVEFNASSLPSGVYFYQLKATPSGGQAGSFFETKKMLLLK